MTREEAIERLNIHKSTSVFVDSIAEAIDMAIEALSADTVSREHHDMEIKELKRQIKDQAEMVAVVRCKDCRHRDLFSCPLTDNDFQKDDDYCSWGERREE